MYKTTQDNSDFMNRTGSHATKGSKRGIVRDVPIEAIEEFFRELETFASQARTAVSAATANLETAQANLKAVKERLKSLHGLQAKMRNSLIILQQSAKIHGWTNGRRKGAARSMRFFNLAADAIGQLDGIKNALSWQANPMHGVLAPPQSNAEVSASPSIRCMGSRALLQSDALAPVKGGASTPCTGYQGYGQHNSHNFNDYERGD